jgi:hypothetical protein
MTTETFETLASGATIKRTFAPGDRYSYDNGRCSHRAGYAQIDTAQDASYYGTWANPTSRVIVTYCEGDVTETVCPTDEIFAIEIRRIHAWNIGNGSWKGIDPMCVPGIETRFQAMGLGDLLH